MELLECLKELVKLEKDWIPDKEGFSLYIRPTAISMCVIKSNLHIHLIDLF